MLIVRWIGRLLAVPLLWLAQLSGYVMPAMAARLYAIAWWLDRDGETAAQALAMLARSCGEAAALAQAVYWLQCRPQAAIASAGGLLALQSGKIELAWQMLQAGKPLGTDRDGRMELLEWLLTNGSGDGAAVQALAQRLGARRDLPPPLTQQVLIQLLWEALQHQRFEEARERADHLLSIDDVPQAEMALWTLARREGDVRRAQRHLQRARLDDSHKLSFQILGSIAIGDTAGAGELVAQLQQVDPRRAQALQTMLVQESRR